MVLAFLFRLEKAWLDFGLLWFTSDVKCVILSEKQTSEFIPKEIELIMNWRKDTPL